MVSKGVGELAQFVARALQGDALGQVLLTCRAGRCGEPVHRPQDASGDDPARDGSEHGDADQGEQRVDQQVGERGAALCGGARPHTVGIQLHASALRVGDTTGLRRLDALLDLRLYRRRDPSRRRVVQAVRDQQVGDDDEHGPAQREQRRVEQGQPRPGAEVVPHSR
jgi:hypothetical protein